MLALLISTVALVANCQTDQCERSGARPRHPVFRPSIGGSLAHCAADLLAPSQDTPPDSVHRMRPADLGLVAALGDSIMVGAYSENGPFPARDPSKDERKEFRRILDRFGGDFFYVGNSFAMGGDETLKTHITLPNILKSLNSDVAGYSVGRVSYDKSIQQTRLNVAVGGRLSSDLPRQTVELLERLQLYPNSKEQWKLVHIFIGTNDFFGPCNMKKPMTTTPSQYKAYVRESLEMMARLVKRTIVSIIPMWNSNLTMLASDVIYGGRPRCPPGYASAGQELIDGYRKVVDELVAEREFESDDFTVVVQHIFDDLYTPLRDSNGYFVDFLADDFFHLHLSKFGNNLVAKNLWRALLSPVGSAGKRATNEQLIDTSEDLACPDPECPFIRTSVNSVNCGESPEKSAQSQEVN